MSEKSCYNYLITAHLQEDFLYPVGKGTPNNVGFVEATRLVGKIRTTVSDKPVGPLGTFCKWFCDIPEGKINIIHLKEKKKEKIVKDSKKVINTDLIFGLEDKCKKSSNHSIIEVESVNSFVDTTKSLYEIFKEPLEKCPEKIKVAIVGLNSESTITFLVYELSTRYRISKIATCRALTGSKSRLQHSNSLNQLSCLFKVEVFNAILQLQNWLYFDAKLHRDLIKQVCDQAYKERPKNIELTSAKSSKDDVEHHFLECTGIESFGKIELEIAKYLYRDSSVFHAKSLTGGFSGAKVYRVKSCDWYGQEQSTTVLKTGKLKKISGEKTNFERVSAVLGNCAPSIVDYVELEEKAGIKFFFASMAQDEPVTSFRDIYLNGKHSQEFLDKVLRVTFSKILGRFYKAAKWSKVNLLDKYDFNGKGWAWKAGGTDTPHLVKKRLRDLLGEYGQMQNDNQKILNFSPQFLRKRIIEKNSKDSNAKEPTSPAPPLNLKNVGLFLENDLPIIKRDYDKVKPMSLISFVHGDLNGRNILLDVNNNVWVIDFEYTYIDHVLKDIMKLEADIFIEYTRLETIDDYEEAIIIAQEMLKVRDLGLLLPRKLPGLKSEKMKKAWNTIRFMREIVAKMVAVDRSSLQMDIVLLRYYLWAITWDFIPKFNRTLAAALACGFAEKIERKMKKNAKLYIKWVEMPSSGDKYGRLGISILPGTRINSLEKDVKAIKERNVQVIFVFCSDEEMIWDYNRKESLESHCKKLGIELKFFPIEDQSIPTVQLGHVIVKDITQNYLEKNKDVLLVSFAGLGRCGVIASCCVMFDKKYKGKDSKEAVEKVKRVRGARAIETVSQHRFVELYHGDYIKSNDLQ